MRKNRGKIHRKSIHLEFECVIGCLKLLKPKSLSSYQFQFYLKIQNNFLSISFIESCWKLMPCFLVSYNSLRNETKTLINCGELMSALSYYEKKCTNWSNLGAFSLEKSIIHRNYNEFSIKSNDERIYYQLVFEPLTIDKNLSIEVRLQKVSNLEHCHLRYVKHHMWVWCTLPLS